MLRAVLLSGGIYHDFERMSAATAGVLATADMAVEIVHSPEELVAALDRTPADLIVVQALRWRMLGNEKYEPFREEWAYETGTDLIASMNAHVARGGGVLSLHTGCICFDDWPGWQAILGGGWIWGESFHAPGLEPVDINPAADHPVAAGISPFTVVDEHYRNLALHPGSVVLAQGATADGVSHPVAWAREGADFAGRAVTLTIGHDLASLTEPRQARFIRQAALWSVGKEKDGQA
jgi:type 1 glutamine amidotransferase